MFMADLIGIDNIHTRICDFKDEYGEKYWQPSDLQVSIAATQGKISDFTKH